MKSQTLRAVVFLATVQFAGLAIAAIEIGDDDNFGAGSLTLDNDTGLAWLDPAATLNKSFNEVTSLLASDSLYVGFRYATRAELETFFEHLGLPVGNFPNLSFLPDGGASFFDAATFVGTTPTPANVYTTRGLTADAYLADQHYYGSILVSVDGTFTMTAANSALFDGAQNGGIGSWLVRDIPADAEVPEPASLIVWSLLGTVAAAIAWRHRRRNSPNAYKPA